MCTAIVMSNQQLRVTRAAAAAFARKRSPRVRHGSNTSTPNRHCVFPQLPLLQRLQCPVQSALWEVTWHRFCSGSQRPGVYYCLPSRSAAMLARQAPQYL